MYLVSNIFISLFQVPVHSPLQTFKFCKASNILFLAAVSSTFSFQLISISTSCKTTNLTYSIVHLNIFASTVLKSLSFQRRYEALSWKIITNNQYVLYKKGKRLARELAISTNNETAQQTLFECSTLNGKLLFFQNIFIHKKC